MRGIARRLALVLALSMTVSSPAQADDWPVPLTRPDCDRDCLLDRLDSLLEGLAAGDQSRVPWAEQVRFTENNVALELGDGIWGTIEGMGDYELSVVDAERGQVGFFGTVREPEFESLIALRMAVSGDRISELEMVILRMVNEPKGIVWPEPILEHKPIFYEEIPEDQRWRREQLIAVADGYFDTLQLNDGKLFTGFHPECNRVENGTLTTNNTAVAITAVGALGCEEQFRQGNYRYDDRLRERRYPLVDVERGLVLAAGFIDHSGRTGSYELTDGRVVDAPLRYPHSFYLLELFRIEQGLIRQIESVFVTVPYGMPSPWAARPASGLPN